MNDYEDPVRFVFRTWPWREDVAGLPQALRPVLGPVSGLGLGSGSSRNRWKNEDPKNDDPLVMLHQNSLNYDAKALTYLKIDSIERIKNRNSVF